MSSSFVANDNIVETAPYDLLDDVDRWIYTNRAIGRCNSYIISITCGYCKKLEVEISYLRERRVQDASLTMPL